MAGLTKISIQHELSKERNPIRFLLISKKEYCIFHDVNARALDSRPFRNGSGDGVLTPHLIIIADYGLDDT
jgi:hypothetical protein